MSGRSRDRRTFLGESLLGVGALGGGALAFGAGTPAPAARPGPSSVAPTAGMRAEARLRELGIRLPEPEAQQGSIVSAVEVGNLLFVSGHGPRGEDGRYVTGKVGADLDADQGNAAARAAALTLIAAVRNHLGGSLDRVQRVVKALGMVNSAPDFTQQPRVVNGFSDTLIELFGDQGRGARSAVGVASLPNNWAVEVEVILEITPA